MSGPAQRSARCERAARGPGELTDHFFRIDCGRLVAPLVRQVGPEQLEAAEAARATIVLLRARGHSVSLDDFGTGGSGLERLSGLVLDHIKIDEAFTSRAISAFARERFAT